jgi:hypothetical protein
LNGGDEGYELTMVVVLKEECFDALGKYVLISFCHKATLLH